MDLQTILADTKLAAVRFDGDQNFAAVFVKAFDDKGNHCPMDFDDPWQFLGRS